METTIKFPMTERYVQHWTVENAIREILQNFYDFEDGKFATEMENNRVRFCNHFMPENLNFLLLGESGKNEDNIGKYGEGLKLAMMILKREGYNPAIECCLGKITCGFMESEAFTEEIFFINIDDSYLNEGFEFIIDCEDIWQFGIIEKAVEANKIHNAVVRHETNYGELLVPDENFDMAGNIYVGGLFVTKQKNLKFGYNIKPKYATLKRDRTEFSWYDVSDIIRDITKETIPLRERIRMFLDYDMSVTSYSILKPENMNDISKEISFDESGNFYHNNKQIQEGKYLLSGYFVKHSKQYKTTMKKKIKITARKPYNILKNFKKKIERTLSNEDKLMLEKILEKSKEW